MASVHQFNLIILSTDEVQMKYGEGKDGNPRTRGVLVRRFTGDSTPYTFSQPRPVRFVKDWPDAPPFTKKDFFRADENDDESFYTLPRLVYHIDEPAVATLTQYYRNNIPKGSSILGMYNKRSIFISPEYIC